MSQLENAVERTLSQGGPRYFPALNPDAPNPEIRKHPAEPEFGPLLTRTMLIQQLRALEQDGIVDRIEYRHVAPKVEYRLTQLGQGLGPVLNALPAWAAVFSTKI